MMKQTKADLPRESDGKYAIRNLEAVCVCGHTVGMHTAENPRECIAGDFTETHCNCERFKKTRK